MDLDEVICEFSLTVIDVLDQSLHDINIRDQTK